MNPVTVLMVSQLISFHKLNLMSALFFFFFRQHCFVFQEFMKSVLDISTEN